MDQDYVWKTCAEELQGLRNGRYKATLKRVLRLMRRGQAAAAEAIFTRDVEPIVAARRWGQQMHSIAMRLGEDDPAPAPAPDQAAGQSASLRADAGRLILAWMLGVNTAARTLDEWTAECEERQSAISTGRGPLAHPVARAVASTRMGILRGAALVASGQSSDKLLGDSLVHYHTAQYLLAPHGKLVADVARVLRDGCDLPALRGTSPGLGATLVRAGASRVNARLLGDGEFWRARDLDARRSMRAPCPHCGDRDCHVHCPLVAGGAHVPAPPVNGVVECKRCGREADTMIADEPVWWFSGRALADHLAEKGYSNVVEEMIDLVSAREAR